MGTITAQIIIGDTHPNHGGIYPTHYLYLLENHRATWLLTEQSLLVEQKTSDRTISWSATLDGMLEDALLMVSLYIHKDPQMRKMINQDLLREDNHSFDYYNFYTKEERTCLYEKNRATDFSGKMIVNVFEGSTLMSHLKILEQYSMELEVAMPVYSRTFSMWSNSTIIKGSLLAEDID